MALKMIVNFKGIIVDDAYIRVGIYQGNKSSLAFAVTYHANQDENAFEVKDFECPLNLDGPNPLEQAYKHLKQLPEFADAVDC